MTFRQTQKYAFHITSDFLIEALYHFTCLQQILRRFNTKTFYVLKAIHLHNGQSKDNDPKSLEVLIWLGFYSPLLRYPKSSLCASYNGTKIKPRSPEKDTAKETKVTGLDEKRMFVSEEVAVQKEGNDLEPLPSALAKYHLLELLSLQI